MIFEHARFKSGEKPNRTRMAQVGTVYSLVPYPRTADDVLGELQSLASCADAPRPKRPRPVNERLFASIKRNYADVIDQGFQEALARDPEQRRRWVVLLDGNPDQLGAVHRAAARLGVEVTIVADLIHLIEYLWPASGSGASEEEARNAAVAAVRLMTAHRLVPAPAGSPPAPPAIDLDQVAELALHVLDLEQRLAETRARHERELQDERLRSRQALEDVRHESGDRVRRASKSAANRATIKEREALGRQGGRARDAKLDPARKTEIARAAASARWEKWRETRQA